METNEKKEKILKRVEKLLAMKTSPNENEVANANLLLKKLLNKYNLDINQIKLIKDKKENIIRTYYNFGSSLQFWEISLGNCIATFYDCKCLFSKYKKDLTFIGFPMDVKITIQVFNYVSESFERIVRDRMAEATNKKGFRQSFFTGAVNSLGKRLQKMKLENGLKAQGKELMVVKEHEINDFLNETYGKLKNSTMRSDIHNSSAYYSGIQTGKTISLNQQIEGDKNV